jgi:hypothetical protein
MAHIMTGAPQRSGWQCPACRHAYGPQVSECPRCPEPFRLFPVHIEGMSCDPPCMTACKPSSEGGLCGCGEPDDRPAPTLILPAEMADPNYRRMLMADRDWREPFPGMQARLGSYSETERKALVEFRLTPADGGRHD